MGFLEQESENTNIGATLVCKQGVQKHPGLSHPRSDS